jgi:hypothetical protein
VAVAVRFTHFYTPRNNIYLLFGFAVGFYVLAMAEVSSEEPEAVERRRDKIGQYLYVP